ncbi:MAG: NAD(P)/FAD-dependent oxidoreductase [Acidobacteriota bacterium]|jgi:phytoene desaturase
MERPFIPRRTEPAAAYDAVVIGSGVGGLTCANLLVRQGLRVLLVEQHYRLGGYCSTFKRAGYVFDAATHFYPLLGNPDTITGKVLADLGVRTRWVKMDPVDTFHLPDGSRFAVPADLDTYLAKLKVEFPAERRAIDEFFAVVRLVYMHGLLHYFRDRPSQRLAPFIDMTVRDALDRYFEDPRLKLLLTADCPHWGSPPKRTSFVFDSMLRLAYFQGNYYPVGGSQAFADGLARRFEEQGGDILMSTRVDEILVRGGAAAGVRAETTRGPLRGVRSIAAGVVVSNADLVQTLERLLGEAHVDPDDLEKARSLRPSYPCFLTHVGLRGVSDRQLHEAQGYYWKTWNPDEVGREGLICKIFSPTLYEPGMAPEGGQIVILQKVLEMVPGDVDDWAQHKAKVEGFVTRHLERVLPGISDKIVVKLSATAMTAHKYTLNTAGSMLGWEMSPDQLGNARPGNEASVRGLFLVGQWVRPGGGITPVIISALKAAESIAGRAAGVGLRSPADRDLQGAAAALGGGRAPSTSRKG